MYKILAFLTIFLFANNCYAQWYETEGSAQIRRGDVSEARSRAVDEAIRQAMLDSGSFVTSEQGISNGAMSTDNFNMSASHDMRQYNLISERRDNGYIIVKVRVFIDASPQKCLGANYPKTILPVLIKYDDGQFQQSTNGLEDFNIELTSKFNAILSSKTKILTKPFFNKNLGIDPLKHSPNEVNLRKTIQQLATQNDAHYVIAGVIRDISLHKDDDGWFATNFGDDNREFSLSIYVFDGYSGDVVYTNNYSGSAKWEFSGNANVHSDYFWSSQYGTIVSKILTQVGNDTEQSIACNKPIGRILKIMPNGEMYINLGKQNGIRQGTRFYVEHNSSFTDHNNSMRFSKSKITNQMVATEVYSNTSILKSIGTSSGNIQINDFAFIE